jgi:hypothetical protein
MKKKTTQCELSPEECVVLLDVLEARFKCHMNRHPHLEWAKIQTKLTNCAEKIKILHDMEETGGEPDVIGLDHETGELLFIDCSPESPLGRRSLCYDRQRLESRKKNRPTGSAIEMAGLSELKC